jgi:hypothetical protein
MTSFRALVTGSRTWSDRQAILNALREHASQPGLVVVHGACPKGADALADELAREYGVQVERHPADWGTHGRAFIHNGSKGSTMTADLAEKAGIPTWRFTVEDN